MEQKPITVFAKWQVKDEHLDTVLNLFTELVDKTRKEEGNLFYTVHQSITEPNTFMLYEAYKDEAAVAAHRASGHFQTIALAQIIPLLQNREVILATQIF
jgi:(4S)-4-hydroxy-5-phosphonooxypentane-2,3-dione isomerase